MNHKIQNPLSASPAADTIIAEAAPTQSDSLGKELAQQKQDNQDHQNRAESTAWVIAPIPAMRPGGERADQQQNEQNQ